MPKPTLKAAQYYNLQILICACPIFFLLFAGDNVVRAWNKLWYKLYHNPPTPINNIIHIDNIGELLVQIRKSLGYPKTQVDKRDMFTWLIKDIEKMDKLVEIAKKAQNLQSN